MGYLSVLRDKIIGTVICQDYLSFHSRADNKEQIHFTVGFKSIQPNLCFPRVLPWRIYRFHFNGQK